MCVCVSESIKEGVGAWSILVLLELTKLDMVQLSKAGMKDTLTLKAGHPPAGSTLLVFSVFRWSKSCFAVLFCWW